MAKNKGDKLIRNGQNEKDLKARRCPTSVILLFLSRA